MLYNPSSFIKTVKRALVSSIYTLSHLRMWVGEIVTNTTLSNELQYKCFVCQIISMISILQSASAAQTSLPAPAPPYAAFRDLVENNQHGADHAKRKPSSKINETNKKFREGSEPSHGQLVPAQPIREKEKDKPPINAFLDPSLTSSG